MKLYYSNEQFENDVGLVTLAFLKYNNLFYKILKVAIKSTGGVFYFFENEFIESELDGESDTAIQINPFEKISIQAALKAIEVSIEMNKIKFISLEADIYEKETDKDWFRSYKLTTSLGCLPLGFGFEHGCKTTLNFLYGWPSGLIFSVLKNIDYDIPRSFKKGLILSLIGLDNLRNLSSPESTYINPLKMDFQKAS